MKTADVHVSLNNEDHLIIDKLTTGIGNAPLNV